MDKKKLKGQGTGRSVWLLMAGLLPALALAATTRVEYDAAGRVAAETDANGNRTSYAYDKTGRKVSETNALGETRRTDYDAFGNVVAVTSPTGIVTRYTVDEMSRRTRIDTVDGSVVTRVYDALGRKVSEIDENGHPTAWAYDALGRLASVTDAAGQVTTFSYDEAGNRIGQILANGKTTRWTYDADHRLLSETLPMGQRRTLTYTSIGQPGSDSDFRGQTTTYSYDEVGQLLRRQMATGSITYSYDRGLVLNVTEPRGTTVNSYDAVGRLLSRQDSDGVTVSYGYDAIGRRERVSAAQGDTRYTFDALGRLATVVDAQGQVTAYAYDSEGRKAKEVLPNGVVTTYAYWPRGWVKTITHQQGLQGPVLATYTYAYDGKGRRTGATEVQDGVTRQRQFGYDELDRLMQETLSYTDGQGHTHSSERRYSYDTVSNRTLQTLQESQDGTVVRSVVTTYTYDDNSRLIAEQEKDLLTQVVQLRQTDYDANGNPVSVTENGTTTLLTYDTASRLSAVSGPGLAARYEYDAEGNRIAKTVNGQSTRFTLDTSQAYVQVLEATDSLGNQRRVTYGLGPVAERANGVTQWVLKDAQQSSRVLVDTTGQPAAHLYYTAFGESEAGTAAGVSLLHRYDGEQLDEETGNYYLRARYMSPGLGRFTQKDGWTGDPNRPVTLNQYLFADGGPLDRVDPSGRQSDAISNMEALTVLATLLTAATGKIAIASSQQDSDYAFTGEIGVGVNEQVQAEMGFPDVIPTAMARSRASAEERLEQAKNVIAREDVDVTRLEMHHPIPTYLCGARDQSPNWVFMPSRVHQLMHFAMTQWTTDFDYYVEEEFNRQRPFSTSRANRRVMPIIAAQQPGRRAIATAINMFYEIGWYELVPGLNRGFSGERPLFERSIVRTSLPECTRSEL